MPEITIADLGPDDTYLGLRTINKDHLAIDDVPLPDGCDLPPNRYYWDRAAQTFRPLSRAVAEDKARAVLLSHEVAIALGFVVLSLQGLRLPPETLHWTRRVVSGIDSLGMINDPGTRAQVQRFLTEVN